MLVKKAVAQISGRFYSGLPASIQEGRESRKQRPRQARSPHWIFVWGDVTGVGGTEKRMAAVATEVINRGGTVQSVVRTSTYHSPFTEVIESSSSGTLYAPSWVRLLQTVRDSGAQTTWSFGLKQSLALRALKLFGLSQGKLVMARNGLDFGWKTWHFRVDVLTQRLVDKYIANSERVRHHLINKGISARKVMVVNSGISPAWHSGRNNTATNNFIMVGNSRAEKNHEAGVRAFLEADLDTTLTVYTDDGDKLRQLIKRAPSQSRANVIVHEGVRLTPEHYDTAGVLLHPSTSESMPLAILEGTSRGCYVVAGQTGDIEQVLSSGFGEVVNPHRADQLVSAIKRAHKLVSEPNYVKRFANHKTVSDYTEELLLALGASTEGSP